MSGQGFCHLHLHTEYSLLDGAIRIKSLMEKCKELGMTSVAITDHGCMYGVLDFYLAARDAGIKPIIGCEVYVARRGMGHKDSPDDKSGYHLVLLAKNDIGYRNLTEIVTAASIDGFYYKPRVDKQLLRKHSEGLIALSACLGGELARTVLDVGDEEAEKVALEYADIFPGNYCVEIQANGMDEQKKANIRLVALARKLGLPLVATNDCHYLNKSEKEAHDVLLCIQTQKMVDDKDRMASHGELWFKTEDEMRRCFKDVSDACDNTIKIAESCDVTIRTEKENGYLFPVYDLPDGVSLEEEFRRVCLSGLERRMAESAYVMDEKTYRARLDEEMGIILSMGFPAYFLIVQDFINWAKNNRIPVGPGRGSAAGSLVAYAMRITNLDPIPNDLLFERFLNPERVSMPDIDVDFCERRRLEVVEYVARKYGVDKTAQITTYGSMKAKAALKDVGRALGLPYDLRDKFSKMIPDGMSLKEAFAVLPEITDEAERDDRVRKMIEISPILEGLNRHASTHAAGVVVSDKPMTEYLPLYKGKKGEIVTQWDMKKVEKVGLVKFDFLGLRTMTVIEDALDNVALLGGERPNLDILPLDDERVYRMYADGDMDGVFQMESDGMRRYLTELKPTCFEDIVAMCALYRPGPLGSGMVESFIRRKHGEEDVSYPLPQLEECLKPTYGVIVYQEQVMQIAREVAGYSLGDADLLRRAMGKKIQKEMDKQRDFFVDGAVSRGVGKAKASEIFELMAKFAEYGFNKSHSAAYALISYHTAWLKTYHKTAFMAALMTTEMNDTEKVNKYVLACDEMGIKVLPPSIGESRFGFTPTEDGVIRYGLGAVKGIGEEAIKDIIKARRTGPYFSLIDLCERTGSGRINKKVLEALVQAGACDGMGASRNGMFSAIPALIDRIKKRKKNINTGQASLFGLLESRDQAIPGIGFDCPEQDLPEWDVSEILARELAVTGTYMSGHPIDKWAKKMEATGAFCTCAKVAEMENDSKVIVAGVVSEIKRMTTRKDGKPMGKVFLRDREGVVGVTIFPKQWPKVIALIEEAAGTGTPLAAKGAVDISEQFGVGIKVFELEKLSDLMAKGVRSVSGMSAMGGSAYHPKTAPKSFTVSCDKDKAGEKAMESLRLIMSRNKGDMPVTIRFVDKSTGTASDVVPGADWKVGPGFQSAIAGWQARYA